MRRGKIFFLALIFSSALLTQGMTKCSRHQEIWVQAIIQNNSDSSAKVAQYFMYELSKKMHPDDVLVLEHARDDVVVSLETTHPDRDTIIEITRKQLDGNPKTKGSFEPVLSSEEALKEGLQRFIDHAHAAEEKKRILRTFIVTSGISNYDTLNSMKHMSKSLADSLEVSSNPKCISAAPQISLYVIGLEPENNRNISNAVSPLSKKVHLDFAGTTYKAWKELLDEALTPGMCEDDGTT